MVRILLPTDFSDNAVSAIHYGLNLFKDVPCIFFLMNSYMPPVYHTEYLLGSPAQIGLGDIVRENSMNDLTRLKHELEQDFQNPLHTFITHSALNILSNEVARTVEAELIELIIMGTQGATGAKEILFGTNTVDIIRSATCPVLAIPSKYAYESPKQILFPNDFEVSLDKEAIFTISKIMRAHASTLHVMHVFTGLEPEPHQVENKKNIDLLFNKRALFHEVASNEVIAAINEFQLKQKVNLLVMMQNNHTFLKRLFKEPVIKKIGFHITIPFLVIPHR